MAGLFNNIAPYHVLLFSLAFGTNVFHSYINAPVLFKNLKREDFSHVTNLILPKYFIVQAAVPLGLYLTSPILKVPQVKKFSGILLGITSGFHLLNYFWILPTVQALKKEKLSLEAKLDTLNEETEADEIKSVKGDLRQLSSQFGKYHGISLLFNMGSTISTTLYGFVLTKGLISL